MLVSCKQTRKTPSLSPLFTYQHLFRPAERATSSFPDTQYPCPLPLPHRSLQGAAEFCTTTSKDLSPASHSTNTLASLRRSAMPSEAQMARFMYYIVKQLDVRNVDWNQVAQDMEITNGHAARMRFARFKNQMEGTVPKARAPRDKAKSPKAKRVKTKDEKKEEVEEKTMLKLKIEDSASPMEGQEATPGSMISESDIRQATGSGTMPFDGTQMQTVKPEPVDEVRLEDLDAPGEAIDARELAHHDSQMASGSDQAQATPELLHHHDLHPDLPFQQNQPHKPEGQHEYHHQPQQAGNPAEYSRASSFSFSNDLMTQLSPQMFLPIMEEGCSQNTMAQEMRLPSPNAFYDPYMYQQQHMGINGHGQIVKNEQPWDSSYC